VIPRPGWLPALLLIAAAIAFVIPVGFVETLPVFTWAAWASLAAGSILTLIVLSRTSGHSSYVVLGLFVLLIAFNTIVAPGPVFAAMFLPFLVGLGVAAAIQNPSRLFLVCLIALVASLLLDQVAGAHVVSNFFGVPFQIRYAEDILRARGFIGQPVPAAMIAVYLGAMSLGAPSGDSRRPALTRVLILALVTVALILTGTRTAVLLLIILVLIIWLTSRREGPIRVSPYVVLATITTAVVLLIAWSSLAPALAGSRAFDFAGLSGSVSLDNRNSVVDVWTAWLADCRGTCVAFGLGWTNLQATLRQSLSSYGLSTVDNLYMSILWDFGVLGLVLLCVIAVAAIVAIVKKAPAGSAARMGAIGSLAIIASGASYDSLYIRPVMMIFGFSVYFLTRSVSEMRSRDAIKRLDGGQFVTRFEERGLIR